MLILKRQIENANYVRLGKLVMSITICLHVIFLKMIERGIMCHAFTKILIHLMNIEDVAIMTQTAIFCKKIVTNFGRANRR